jgi:hypothetical protein
MDLRDRLETIIPVGEAAAYASALRKKAEETTGDTRSISQMELYRIYNAGKRALLSTLLRHLAKRHLRLAIRSAEYYPDALEMHAALLGKEGDLWKSAKEYEDVILKQRAWIEVFKDLDGSSPNMMLHVSVREPGTYKLWLQFRGGDQLYIAPFIMTAN